jgi:mRNA interferase HigB
MVVLSYPTIRNYTEKRNQAVKDAFNNWYKVTCEANWASLNEVKKIFPATDYVGNDRYIFNIMGNSYRLVAIIHFNVRTVYIAWLGTHKQYDKIDASSIQFQKK